MPVTREQAEEAARRAKAKQQQRQAKPNGAAAAAPLAYTLLRDLKADFTNNDVVRDLIPRGGLGEVHAAPSAGKTAIIVDLVLHIAAGRRYRGRRTDRQPVVYVALEGHKGINNRVIAAAAYLDLDVADVPFALVKAAENFRIPRPPRKQRASPAIS